jgi:predicted DNA-binding transcriptional regulator YafY
LALYFWSGVWTLASWCELRKDFRTFRMDRMQDVRVLGREFVQKKGQRLEDYLLQVMKKDSVRALPKRA